MRFYLTRGNVDDRKVVDTLTTGLTGLIAADKGYIDKKLTDRLTAKGLTFITKVKKT
jgi:hypothetical protein